MEDRNSLTRDATETFAMREVNALFGKDSVHFERGRFLGKRTAYYKSADY